MRRLIDIAGRTGHAPVRTLLAEAVGTTDPDVLLPHEIRYRNDQHHVIYGLYDDNRILGLVGLARSPADVQVEIRHFAATTDASDAAVELLERIVDRHPGVTFSWQVPQHFDRVARSAGFQPDSESNDDFVWTRRTGGPEG